MKLSALLQEVETQAVTAQEVEINGITDRAQDVQKGNVFVCVPGRTVDGHRFAGLAAQRGAVALITRRPLDIPLPQIIVQDPRAVYARMCGNFYGNPGRRMELTAVTGTNGKTTTAWMLHHIFTDAGYKTGRIGTIPEDDRDLYAQTHYTTPDPPALHRTLRMLARQEVQHTVMEASSQALAQRRLDGLHFACGVFTNLTAEHMDFHRSMEDYYRAKRSLFDQCDCAVIYIDDPWGARLTREIPCRTVTVSEKYPMADYFVEKITTTSRETEFVLHRRGLSRPVVLPMIGTYNVRNAVCAAAVAETCGAALRFALNSLENLPAIPGRMERLRADVPFEIYIDYAHTPAALRAALEALRRVCHGRLIVVFGCGGDRDRSKRPEMGRIADIYGDHVILTNDNPRSEDPQQILQDIAAGMTPGGFRQISDRAEAINTAIQCAEAGDIVLIAGKGHEQYQILNDGVYPLNEYRIAERATETWKKERNDESWNRSS